MKKVIYFIFTIIVLFTCSLNVKADRGDLIYNIDSVSVNDEKITIKGYAFIHRTQNYVTIYKRNNSTTNNVSSSDIVKSGGGQKIKIKIQNQANSNSYLEKTYNCVDDKASSLPDYNFYYQMFYKDGTYSVDKYNNFDANKCNTNRGSQCYYEDIAFEISFTLEELLRKFSSDDTLKLYISAYNNDYGSFTAYRELKIPQITGSSDFVEIVQGENRNGRINFIASTAILRNLNETSAGFYGCTRPRSVDSNFGSTSWCGNDYNTRVANSVYYLVDGVGNNGYVTTDNDGLGGYNFLNGTKSPGMFALCVNRETRTNACTERSSDNYCTSCSGSTLYAYTSWIELTGTNQLMLKVKDQQKCDPVVPASGDLECNGGKDFNSTCNELTITTGVGLANVKIEQTGTVSSVLTPERTYAGSGFSFGVMYYNKIKWSYVDSQPNNTLHAAVTSAMNDKLKNYSSYIAGINLTEIKLGGKVIDSSLMVKSCTTSDSNIDYYNKELEVSCVFYFPESELLYNGEVNYTYGAVGDGISNKYYTPLDYSGIYKIEAKIEGMDRITNSSALNDSGEQGKKWTGNWTDTFKNCQIDIYDLFYENGKYNFIYRPIDIYNPFPNRNAGINWYDWYSIERNKEKLEATYTNSAQYSATLNNQSIANIKRYNVNSTNGYFDWNTMTSGGNSTFVDSYFDTKRVGVE